MNKQPSDRMKRVVKAHLANLSTREIADSEGIDPRSVVRLIDQAQEDGYLLVLKMLAPKYHDQTRILDNIAEEVKVAFGLKEVLVVQGSFDVIDHFDESKQTLRDAILHLATCRAAEYLEDTVKDEDILCVAWGRVVHSVICSLRPPRRPNLTVIPMLGYLALQPFWFEANTLALEMARVFQTLKCHMLPVPAIVPDIKTKTTLLLLPQVEQVSRLYDEATYVVTRMGAANAHAQLVQQNVLTKEQMNELSRLAVGEINAWFFDDKGNSVKTPVTGLGLGLQRLSSIAENHKKTVVGIVAADGRRINALYCALKNPEARYLNVLVTDQCTAIRLMELKQKNH